MKEKIIVNCVTLSRVNESFLIIRKKYVKKFVFFNVIVFTAPILAIFR